MARLSSTVHVDGKAYGPDDTVPSEVAVRITNPKAWEGGELPSAPAAPSVARGAAPPPKGGAGSSTEAWAAYAAYKDVEVPADASRDDIVAAIEAAGHPTE